MNRLPCTFPLVAILFVMGLGASAGIYGWMKGEMGPGALGIGIGPSIMGLFLIVIILCWIGLWLLGLLNREEEYTFDDNIDISSVEAHIEDTKDNKVKMTFPTKGLSYKIWRNENGVVVQKEDLTTGRVEKPVLYSTNSYRFGSTPDRSAAESIKKEVHHTPDRR